MTYQTIHQSLKLSQLVQWAHAQNMNLCPKPPKTTLGKAAKLAIESSNSSHRPLSSIG